MYLVLIYQGLDLGLSCCEVVLCPLRVHVCDHVTATHCPAVLVSLPIHKVPVNWSLKSVSIPGFSCSDADRKLAGSF